MREKQPFRKKILQVLMGVLLFLLVTAGRSAQWALEEWGGLNLDEILFTLTQPLNGADSGIWRSYILYAVIPAALILAAAVFLQSRTGRRFFLPLCLCLSACFFGFWAVRFFRVLGIGDYLHTRGVASSWIEDNYKDPARTELTFPEKKRNLIYLYLESMEVAYADEESGGIFEDNYIPRLTQIAQDAEDFRGAGDTQLNGASSWKYSTWTMGGMFAATSGLVLKIPLEADGVDTNFMSTQKAFFPNLTTLGDILEENGYVNDLLIGSDATFGGRRLYFSEHGGYAFHDFNYYAENGKLPRGYKVFWGFEDEKLFAFAKERLGELAKGDQPFNLTMLTVDTHYPKGYTCRLCGREYASPYANAIACSDRQTADFLAWCAEQDWYEDTTIIVSGDHPTMATFCDQAPEDYTRRVYTAYLNPAARRERTDRREYATVDNFPTTLAALGVTIRGDRLGLGTNLFSSEDTLTERYGAQTVEEELAKASAWMDAQAQVEAVTADVEYDPYDAQNRRLSFTIRNVSTDRIDGFRCCMRMYGYTAANGSDYIEWISAEETEKGVWHAQWEVPCQKAYDGIVKLQQTCMVDGARSHVLELHYYHLRFDEGGENCEWYECDASGNKLEGGLSSTADGE